jgi:Lipocalin-like domain
MMSQYVQLLEDVLTSALEVFGQTPDIAGAWVLAGADKLFPDGTRAPAFGDNPHGLAIFTVDGYYSVQIYGTNRSTFSTGNQHDGTSQEHLDIPHGMSVHFGRYTLHLVNKTITFRLDRACFPNGNDSTRIYTFETKGDRLSWKLVQRSDGSTLITFLRRLRDVEQPKVKGLQ